MKSTFLENLLQDPEVRAGYDEQESVVRAAELVRTMREMAGLTQIELAHRIGTSQAALSVIERGVGRYGPTFLLLGKIADACGLGLEFKITRADAENAAAKNFGPAPRKRTAGIHQRPHAKTA